MSTLFNELPGKPVSVAAGRRLLQLFWPEFREIKGGVFLAFMVREGDVNILSDGLSETECFINHTHILDEFRGKATIENREHMTDDFDTVENSYDENHPDFIAACEIGVALAQMWALKLKLEFPHDRFRVYYTQYDNPIVRFHKVRLTEPLWLTDEVIRDAKAASLRGTIVYDTEHVDTPITGREN